MNAETLGALATIVNEAIAKAVAPLQQRIAELEGGKAYDDSELRASLEGAFNVQEALSARLKALESAEAPTPYDDAPLRQWVADELKELPAPVAVDGIDGAPGADGRDALALEVLPEIDQSKSYVRNTYAKHNGGLWRSFEQTHGMRGWECLVDGVHAVMPSLEGKSLTLTVIQSSGTESVLMADLPIQVYKGVYRPDDSYTAHDTATWAGSLWHCNVTGTKAKPGDGSSDWTLAVKKGRDAKEVVRV